MEMGKHNILDICNEQRDIITTKNGSQEYDKKGVIN
jgi:hypothetical protein